MEKANEVIFSEAILKGKLFEAIFDDASFERIIHSTLQVLREHLEAIIGEFWINTSSHKDDLVFYSTIGNEGPLESQTLNCAATHGFVSTLWEQGIPRILNDIQSNKHFLRHEFAQEKNLTSVMGIPLKRNEKVIGVMCFFRSSSGFDHDEILSKSVQDAVAIHLNDKVVKDQFERYFNMSRDVFAILDMRGHFLKVNNSFLELLGYSKEEVISKDYTQFIHPDDIKSSEEAAKNAFSGEEIIRFENRLQSKFSDYKCIRWSTHTDVKKRLIYAAGKDITDITTQKFELTRKSLELHERVKELNGLYSILKVLNESDKSFSDKLTLAVEFIPSSFQYPELTCAEIVIDGNKYRTTYFNETANKLFISITVHELIIGEISVYLLKENISFLKEEEDLVESIATNISGALELEKSRSLLHRLSLIAQETTNFVIICNKNGYIEWVNGAFEAFTGYNLDEIVGKRPSEFLHGQDTNKEIRDRFHFAVKNQQPISCELLKYKKDKTPYWVSIEGKPLRDPTTETTHYFQIETDITETKNNQRLLMEAEQNARRFANDLNQVLEEERAHWAREIHDEFGQQLSGIKMSLATLNRINFEPETSQLIVADVVKSLEEATKSLKAFSTQLRPAILDSLGIGEAVEWLADEFVKKSAIEVNKNIDDKGAEVDQKILNNIFRICQESLNNIAKHAQSTLVEISFKVTDQHVTLEIVDNGKGIEFSKINNPFSMGLIGMKERARLTGASLEIDSEDGQYTKIRYRQPLNTNA